MFKFKIDLKDIEKTKVLIEQRFAQVCNDPAMLQDQGKFLTERIRFQARTTKPISEAKFPALKKSTIANRKYLAKYNNTDMTYEANRSNLTLTGAFFNSLGYEITGAGQVTLSFKGNHPPYKGKRGVYNSKTLTNTQLAGYLREKGFSPFDVSALEVFKPIRSRMSAIVKTYLRRALKLS